MKTRIPKSGLAGRMREWMREQTNSFTRRQLWEGIGIPPGPERSVVYVALGDFIKRGEVEVVKKPAQQDRRQKTTYRYNHSWKRASSSDVGNKICKAIYLSISAFTVSDIQRISEAPERSYVTKIIKRLTKHEYLKRLGARRCIHGRGSEFLYSVINRDRFRVEIL